MLPESVRATPVRILEIVPVFMSEGLCPFTSIKRHQEA
jgi:hypothetical protein